MAGTGGIDVGRARVVITPDWSGFSSKLRRFLRSEERKHSLGVRLHLKNGISDDARRAVAKAQSLIQDLEVDLGLDSDGLRRKTSNAIRVAQSAVKDLVVDMDLDDDSLRKKSSDAVRLAQSVLKDLIVGMDLDNDALGQKSSASVTAAQKKLSDLIVGMDLDKDGLSRHAHNAVRKAQATMRDLHVDLDVDDKTLPIKTLAAVKKAQLLTPAIKSKINVDDKELLKDSVSAVKKVQASTPKIKPKMELDFKDVLVDTTRVVKGVQKVTPKLHIQTELDHKDLLSDATRTVLGVEKAAPKIKLRTKIKEKFLNSALVKLALKLRAWEKAVRVKINVAIDKSGVAKASAMMAALTATSGFVKAQSAVTGLATSLGSAGAMALQMGSAMAIAVSGVLALVPVLISAGKATWQFASSLTSLVGAMAVPAITAAGTAFASVAIAIKGMGDAIGATDAEELQDALNELTPSAQTAALAIRDLKNQFDFSGIQEAFFEPLGNLGQVSALIEPLNDVMRTLAGNLGLAASGLVEFLTTGTGLTAMTELLNGTKFAASDLAGGVRNLVEGIVVLGAAAAPIFSRMMSHFLGLAETWKNNTVAAFEDGSLQKSLAEKEASVKDFWATLSRLGGDIKGIFSGIGRAAGEVNKNGGATFLNFLSQVSDWANSASGQQMLQSYFASASSVISSISPIISTLASIVMNDLYPAFADFVSQAAPGVEEFFNGMSEWIQPILDKLPEFGKALGDVFAAIDFEALGEAIGTVMDILNTVVFPILETIAPYIDEIVIAITTLVGIVKTVGLVLTVLEAGPIALIIAAITAVVVAVTTAYRESETFRNILNGIGSFLKDVFLFILDAVISYYKTLWGIIKIVINVVKMMWDAFGSVGESLMEWASTVGGYFSGLKDLTVSAFTTLKDKAVELFTRLKDSVVEKVTSLKDTAVQKFEDLKAKVTEKIDKLKENVGKAVDGVKNFFGGMGDKAEDSKNKVSGAMQGAKDKVSGSLGKLGGKIQENSNKMLGWAVSAAGSSSDMKNKVSGNLATMRDSGSSNMDRFKAAIDLGFNLVVGIAKNFGSKFIGKIKSGLSGLYDSGKSILQSFKDGIRDGFNNITNFVSDKIQGVRDLFPFSPAKKGPFSGHGWVLYSGRSIGPAFAKGINQKITVAEKAAGTLATRVHDSLAVKAPGVAFSPLGKELEKLGTLGETTGDALGNGIRDGIRRGVRESGGDLSALQNHVRTAGGIDLHSRGSMSVDSWAGGASAGGDYSIHIGNLTASSEREAVRQLETKQFKQRIRGGRP